MTTIAITVRPRVTFSLSVEGTAVGATGASAYEIWLAEGNEGTEQDFLDSLEGAAAIVGHENDFDHTLIATALQSETDPVVGAITGIVKADGNGVISSAEAMVDYALTIDIYNTNAWLQNHVYAVGDRFSTTEEGGSTAYYIVHTGFTSDATYNLAGKESLNCYAYFIQDANVANHELSYDHELIGTAILPYRAITSATTILATDYTIDCTSGTFTQPLPTAVGIQGTIYNIKNSGTGVVTIDANGSETIDGQLTQSVYQYDNLQVQSTGAGWIIL